MGQQSREMPTSRSEHRCRRRVRLSRLAWVAFVLAYTPFFLEGYLRAFKPAVIIPRYVVDAPYGVRVSMPNLRIWHKTPDYRIQIRTNSRGARADREFPFDKPDGVFRIVVLGDSFALGYGVSIEDGFLRRLSDRLDEAGQPCEVINLSVSGHSTTEELLVLENEGLKYHPDLVLVGWHETDLAGNVRTDLYRLGEGELVRGRKSFLPAVAARRFLFSLAPYRFLAENSHLYCTLRELASNKVIEVMDGTRALRKKLNRLWQSDTPKGQGPSQPKELDDYEERLAVALLAEIEGKSRRRGARMLILDVPRQRWRDEEAFLVSTLPQEAKNRFLVYNPLADLNKHDMKETFWQRSVGHWTPLGCRIVGDGLADFVLPRLPQWRAEDAQKRAGPRAMRDQAQTGGSQPAGSGATAPSNELDSN